MVIGYLMTHVILLIAALILCFKLKSKWFKAVLIIIVLIVPMLIKPIAYYDILSKEGTNPISSSWHEDFLDSEIRVPLPVGTTMISRESDTLVVYKNIFGLDIIQSFYRSYNIINESDEVEDVIWFAVVEYDGVTYTVSYEVISKTIFGEKKAMFIDRY